MSRAPVDPDVHATPCGIVDLGCDPRHLKVAHAALEWAEDLLDDRVPAEPRLLQTPATYHRDRHEGVGLHLWFEDQRTLDIRRESVLETRLLIGPRMRGVTSLIEARLEDRAGAYAAARRFVAAFRVHLDGLATRTLDDLATIRRLDMLESIEAHVRTSRALPPDIRSKDGGISWTNHDGPVEAATPWSPLRARTITGWGQPGREMLTAAERRLWTDPPVLTMRTGMGTRRMTDGTMDKDVRTQVVVTIDPLAAPARTGSPVMEDMRRLQRLVPPPPVRGRRVVR
jgi:hypothetical protein